jgi:hypothetical protein
MRSHRRAGKSQHRQYEHVAPKHAIHLPADHGPYGFVVDRYTVRLAAYRLRKRQPVPRMSLCPRPSLAVKQQRMNAS